MRVVYKASLRGRCRSLDYTRSSRIDDDVGGAGIERSVVSVELTSLVRRTGTLPCEVTLEKLNIRLL